MNNKITYKTIGERGGNIEIHFPTVRDWYSYALNQDDKTLYDNVRRFIDDFNFSEHRSNNKWNGSVNGAQFRDQLAQFTAPDDLRLLVNKANKLQLPPMSTTVAEQNEQQILMDESGFLCDMNSYYAGEENCMLSIDETPIERPLIWIACSFGGTSNIEPEQFNNRGIALICAVHALERAGVSVGVLGYSYASIGGGQGSINQTVVVKNAGEPLDEITMINMFARPCTLRGLGFAVRAAVTNDDEMGSSTDTPDSGLLNSYCGVPREQIAKLPYSAMQIYNNPLKATKWTLEQIKKQTNIII